MRPAAGVTTWIGGIHSARLLTPGPVGVGSQVERVAAFLGRRVEYVLEVTDLTDEALAMRSVRSPFPMRVTYGHGDASDRATRVSLRVQGDAGRFYALAGPLVGAAVRRSIAATCATSSGCWKRGHSFPTTRPAPLPPACPPSASARRATTVAGWPARRRSSAPA